MNSGRRSRFSTLPLEPNTAQILAQSNVLALNNALVPQSFALSSGGVQNIARRGQRTFIRPMGTVGVKMRIIGTYEDFKRFIRNLETNIRLADVKSISMQQAGRPNQNLYEFDITVDTYYQTQ
jgi:Tfp pilus assembly protein PilO